MPIRDVDTFAPASAARIRVLANRGINGIDGTVSTALGVAAASGAPTVVLLGDLALLHDLGGLLIARRSAIPLTVVVANNDGGGIFSFLPVARVGEAFEPEVADALENPVDFKSALQEQLAQRGELVRYAVVSEEGPPHDRIFSVSALVGGVEVGRGSGRSKKDAEQVAAQAALEATEP